MDKKELITKLEDIEWEDFEVKEAQTEIPKNVFETVSAFSNTAGGWIVFGIKKKGKEYEVLGVKNPEKVEQDFTTSLRSGKFNKKIEVISKKYNLDDKIILAFYIQKKAARDKPVYFNSIKNTFIRTASGDQRATSEEVDAFFRNASFDEKDKELTKYHFNDLDTETIAKYRTYFANVNPGHRYLTLSDEEFLQKLSILVDGKVTYGGLLIFGKSDVILIAVPQFKIEYLEIAGTSYEDAPTRYRFRLTCEYNLFKAFFDIYEQLTKKIDVPFSVKGGFRNDDPAHIQAIREALVNLLIHTDYFSQSTPRIRVFTDRIEFFNPGALPKKIEFILKEDFSLPRNPIIAKTFRYVNLAEGIGSGLHKMLSGWGSHYKIKPEIEGDFDYYKITFPITKTISKTITKAISKEVEKVIELLRKNPKITAEELAKELGISVPGVRYHLQNLKEKGVLKRVGGPKTGKWDVQS